MRWIIAILCLPIAGFCVFGFLATFEPGSPLIFRIIYLTIGLLCLAGMIWPFLPRRRSSSLKDQ